MNAAMDTKRVKLDSSLAKYLPIADLTLGHEFLGQIKRYYDLYYEEPEMNKKISTSCNMKSRGHTKSQMVGVVEFNCCISYVFEIFQDVDFL